MTKRFIFAGTVTLALIASACTRTVGPLQSASSLPPAPSGNVQQQALNPVSVPVAENPIPLGNQTQEIASDQTTQIEPVASAISSEPLERGSIAGVWDVQLPDGTCKFATSFTRRSQHFQASALRCPNPELSGVREWDVAGNQLILYDQSGSSIARLFKTAENRFDGKTNSGTAVTFSRT